MVITSMHKNKLVAEHARCCFKLSKALLSKIPEALEQEPQAVKEAEKLRKEAVRLLHHRDSDANDPGLEGTYDALIDIKWR